ncbi:MAG: hypothetical protein ACPL3C_09400, partial [Pyrobaculum sp.]
MNNEKLCKRVADWAANDSAHRMHFNAVFDVENRRWVDLEIETARWDNVFEVDRWYFSGRGVYHLRPGGHYIECKETLQPWGNEEKPTFRIECKEFYVEENCELRWDSAASFRFKAKPESYFKERGLTILIDLHESSPWYHPRPKLPSKVYSEEEVRAFLDWVRSGQRLFVYYTDGGFFAKQDPIEHIPPAVQWPEWVGWRKVQAYRWYATGGWIYEYAIDLSGNVTHYAVPPSFVRRTGYRHWWPGAAVMELRLDIGQRVIVGYSEADRSGRLVRNVICIYEARSDGLYRACWEAVP